VALVLGIALLVSGRSLRRSGTDASRITRERALLALAAHRGAVTASDAARALGVGIADADAMLTTLAKQEPERVAVDVDEQGVVWYRAVGAPGTAGAAFDARVRVAESARAKADDGTGIEAEPEEEERGVLRR
jgi:spermidine synthase